MQADGGCAFRVAPLFGTDFPPKNVKLEGYALAKKESDARDEQHKIDELKRELSSGTKSSSQSRIIEKRIESLRKRLASRFGDTPTGEAAGAP